MKENMGVPDVVIHNAVRATFDTFLEGDPEDLERAALAVAVRCRDQTVR